MVGTNYIIIVIIWVLNIYPYQVSVLVLSTILSLEYGWIWGLVIIWCNNIVNSGLLYTKPYTLPHFKRDWVELNHIPYLANRFSKMGIEECLMGETRCGDPTIWGWFIPPMRMVILGVFLVGSHQWYWEYNGGKMNPSLLIL
jgi:hypothetical protein